VAGSAVAAGAEDVPGKTSAEREALDRQSRLLMGVFTAAGFDFIAPDVLQPADIFLESSGESIRSTAFVFLDPGGNELCLRPDLTVPTCRYHLSHAMSPDTEARYCYRGSAFRFQPGAGARAELEQAGIEWFNGSSPVAAEAQVLELAIKALEAAGLKNYRVRLGDLGLFHALLESIDMPARWRRRLRHQFWRPNAFHELLDTLGQANPKKRTAISIHVDAVADDDPLRAIDHVAGELERRDLVLVGGRTVEEIAGRLVEKAADRREKPLAAEARTRIDSYLAIENNLGAALGDLRRIEGHHFGFALRSYEERIAELNRRGLDSGSFHFSAAFGRDLEYYTGFVFEIEAQSNGGPLQVAGGGRYDSLLSDLGSPVVVPAVGCAIYSERLLAAAAGGPGTRQ
jgi:ATP phosphoribosyltransferase regulatory subunit